eukprot:TRINITY_DN4546_c0_g1_i1.p1 TRINITY_DN4546_c0_g1~~TRINITY_DN4546_c0_g1_i1.p1  ORF type:complete len:242 (+),score=50.76 TRINITY_DN4546_c0_g1_i1:54-779(+)
MSAAAKAKPSEACCGYGSGGELWNAFRDNFQETDGEEHPFRSASLLIKWSVIIYCILKPVFLIAVSVAPASAMKPTANIIILCVMGIIIMFAGFAGAHFRLINVCILYSIMDLILQAGELGLLINILKAMYAAGTSNSTQLGLVLTYTIIHIIRLTTVIASIVLAVLLYKKEAKEEEEAEAKKKEAEAKEEEEKLRAHAEAKKKARAARRKKRAEDRLARGETDSAGDAPPLSVAIESTLR